MNSEGTNISQASALPENDILDLVRRTLEGDSQAVADLYDLNYQKVYTFAYYSLSGNASLAEDITEDTFIRAFRAIGTFKWKGVLFSSWLVTIARNLIVDMLRRPEPLLLEETWLDSALDPVVIFDQTATRQQLHTALKKLTPEQQEVIILRFFDDLSLVETSEVLGKSITAIKRLQARALLALGTSFKKNES